MQEEDDYYKKKSVSTITKISEEPVMKAVKTQEGQRVPSTQQKIPETKPIEVKEETKKSEDPTFNAALEAIRLMKEKQAKSLVQDKVTFAGKTYNVERAATDKDAKKQELIDKKRLGGQCDALDQLVGLISDQGKNVNCIEKSKIDWTKYTKEEKLEE